MEFRLWQHHQSFLHVCYSKSCSFERTDPRSIFSPGLLALFDQTKLAILTMPLVNHIVLPGSPVVVVVEKIFRGLTVYLKRVYFLCHVRWGKIWLLMLFGREDVRDPYAEVTEVSHSIISR